MGKIVGFGEAVVDFIPAGMERDGSLTYHACPGGSVANLCTAAAKAGASSTFLGKVGDDAFGRSVKSSLIYHGVETRYMIFDQSYGTFLAFVHPEQGGERSYSFLNTPGADKQISFEEIDFHCVDDADIVHVSSCLLSHEKSLKTQMELLAYTKKRGKIISYDINYRDILFSDYEEARERLILPLKQADIVKGTVREIEMVTSLEKSEGAKRLLEEGIRIVLITDGSRGSEFYCRGGNDFINAVRTDAVDTTGAGDCYLGYFLARLAESGHILEKSLSEIREAAVFAARASALSVTRKGGIGAMPTLREVQNIE